MWQGGSDWCVKPVHSAHMAAAIPGATLTTLEGEGHLTMAWRRGADILVKVAGK